MRRISMTALLAVPLLLFTGSAPVSANPIGLENFGCAGYCFKMFPHMHQHGPLFNYGPYYGYYPFKPYGPWDAYLRYDPFFYGDPYANWGAGQQGGNGNYYGLNPNLNGLGGKVGSGFWHASWLHGGWFHGHAWLTAPHMHGKAMFHKSCKSCGGVATAAPLVPTGNVTVRYSGFGTPEQSAVFYSATPTLDPTLALLPVSGR
jgi:hypothetical protein